MPLKYMRLSVIGIFLGTATLLRAAIAPAENLLPSDTLAFVTVPDCNAFRAAAKTSPQMMFWNDPAMKPFHDKFMAKLTEKFIAPLEKDLGIKVDDFLSPLQGQFTSSTASISIHPRPSFDAKRGEIPTVSSRAPARNAAARAVRK